MHDAYVGGRSENNIKMRCAQRSRVQELNNSLYSATSLALRVIFSVSWLWNIFGSFTKPFNLISKDGRSLQCTIDTEELFLHSPLSSSGKEKI